VGSICPSYSISLPEKSVSKKLFSLSDPLNSINEDSTNTEKEFMYRFYNNVYLSKSLSTPNKNIEIDQNVKPLYLEDCDLVKDLSNNMVLESSDEDSQSENSECFVDDPDIINPDIIFNIDLNEHYNKMDILVKKITEIPDEPTVFNECLQLQPIPQIQHETKTFTLEERLNFMNGISEWEYDIDSENWNNIMVKRAVVFTAHAGFCIANEESLYVIADVTIEFIKKMAIIMKKNLDIQSKSSCPDRIDPISNSLNEVSKIFYNFCY